ncbi:uncharacterized protein CDAR_539991 [Caerostris darwini]|uniref:Uncharacterized protein n=1 Tax=Caerostris darwini TaxID=1538125 RepID=A0AAV4TMP1_9ARAC|nr:uncharacterized protein CDAR_539991 [Caerostris darwini]
MSSAAAVLVVLPLLLQSVQSTFPPVSNAPPIPSQAAVRTVDLSATRYYFTDDVQLNQPPNVIKEDGFIPTDDKLDQRYFAPENQSGETGDFPNSDDTFFARYYSDGQPAIGPVATPVPDDTYVAQPSVTSKVLPDNPANAGPSDIWVLTKGPNDQYIPERWVQVQVPVQDKIVEVVNTDVVAPKQYTETVKSFPPVAPLPPPPPPPAPIKAPPVAPPNFVQQIWVRAPAPIQNQKVFQNTPTIVEEVPSVKQGVNIPPPVVKQYIQPQIIKEAQPLPPPPPPPPPGVTKKSSSAFIVPPPPPPPFKGTDKQTVIVNQPVAPIQDQIAVPVNKGAPLPQVRHIWIPTSQQTGKFITVPVGAVINDGKSVPAKGIPVDVPPQPPIAVSDTWVLRQDGPIPRFEEQKTIVSAPPVVQKSNIIVDNSPKFQFDSPKNPPLIQKSIDAPVPADIWPTKNIISEQKIIGPPPPVKGIPQLPLPPPPPPQIVAPVAQVINGKPCPLPLPVAQAKSPFSPKQPVPLPAYRTIALNRPPFGRIIRINRYPYGSYYVLNPRINTNFYTYPRPPVIQQPKNGIVRLIAARPLPVPVPVPVAPRQVAIPVPRKQIVVPASNIKVAPSPVLLYPPVSRIRYTYPWGSYIRSLPITAKKNIFVLPPSNNKVKKSSKIQAAKSSSSESSSSESSSSESKSEEESKPKSKEEEKEKESESEEVAESVGSVETEVPEPEPEPEKEIEDVEVAASVPEPAEEEPEPTEPETKEDSIEVEESQVKPQLLSRGFNDPVANNFENFANPFLYGYDQRSLSGPSQNREEISDPNRRVIGNYGFQNQGIFRNINYVADSSGIKAHVVSNEPGTVSHQTANVNYISNATPENTTNKAQEIDTAASHENLTVDPQRD